MSKIATLLCIATVASFIGYGPAAPSAPENGPSPYQAAEGVFITQVEEQKTSEVPAPVVKRPEIVGPSETVPIYSLARFELQGLNGGTAIWDAIGLQGQGEGDGLESNGGAVFAFTGAPGRYRVQATLLIEGQLSRLRSEATIGGDVPAPPGPAPKPNPPGPGPNPVPILTGLAKVTYESANSLNNPAVAAQYLENFRSINSTIAAGAYNNMQFSQARSEIFAELSAQNRPILQANPSWSDFATAINSELNKLQQAGSLNTLDGILKAFQDIEMGLSQIK